MADQLLWHAAIGFTAFLRFLTDRSVRKLVEAKTENL